MFGLQISSIQRYQAPVPYFSSLESIRTRAEPVFPRTLEEWLNGWRVSKAGNDYKAINWTQGNVYHDLTVTIYMHKGDWTFSVAGPHDFGERYTPDYSPDTYGSKEEAKENAFTYVRDRYIRE